MICDILDDVQNRREGRSRRELITFIKDRPGHDFRYAMDYSKLKQQLGWSPEETFETGIRNTIQWYLENDRWVERVKSGEYQSWIKAHYG